MANLEELFRTSEILNEEKQHLLHMFSGNTNKIFYHTDMKSSLSYYIPAYIRLSFNNIAGIDFTNLKAEAHCDIYFTINVKDLPESVASHVKNNIILSFANNKEICVREINVGEVQANDWQENEYEDDDDDEDEDENEIYFEQQKQKSKGKIRNHYFHFQIRKQFKTNMVANMFLTPFEEIDLILTITGRIKDMKITEKQEHDSNFPEEFISILKKKQHPKVISFYINFMDHPKLRRQTIDYGIRKDFGNYSVDQKGLSVEYTNAKSANVIIQRSKTINENGDQIEEEVNLNKIKNFQYAHFVIRIYRNPNSVTFTIFIPLVLLTIVNLGIFFQSNSLGGRIQNIAGLMFAYTALIPLIRSQIPTNPQVTLIEYIVYVLSFTTIICLAEGIVVRNDAEYQPSTLNIFFLVSLGLSIIASVIVIALIIWHHLIRVPRMSENENERSLQKQKFDHKHWSNEDCDKHFMKFFDNGKVRSSKILIKQDNK